MKVTVNEQPQFFHLAFDSWERVGGHAIQVGEYQFCAIPLSTSINVSEVTSGARVLSIPLDPVLMILTETKEGTIRYFRKVGEHLAKQLASRDNIDVELEELRKQALERCGERPPIKDVDDSFMA